MTDDDRELLEAIEPHWFRIEEHEDGLTCRRVRILKHTPKGARIENGRLILRDYIHRGRAYAAPTLAQAQKNFRLRKEYQISRLQRSMSIAQAALDMLEEDNINYRLR